MKRTYRIEEVSLWLIFMTMAKQLKWLTIIVALEAVVLACVGAFTEAIYFSLILFVGVIGSYSIHEYVHILLLRRNGVSVPSEKAPSSKSPTSRISTWNWS